MISVQALKKRLAETLPVGEWFDIGRVDRLEWRSGPENITVLAVEWGYSRGELRLKIKRKVILNAGEANERYTWAAVNDLVVLEATEVEDLERWDNLLRDAWRQAELGEAVKMEYVTTELRSVPAAKLDTRTSARSGLR